MTTTVVQLADKRPRPVAQDGEPDGATVTWPVKDLENTDQYAKWLTDLVVGTPLDNTAVSLWTHHPNLRHSTEKLARLITPMWPTATGGSLLQLAVETAIRRAQEAQETNGVEGPVIGAYLSAFVSVRVVLEHVARLVIRGEGRDGRTVRWGYFSEPLLQWAERNGIERLTATQARTQVEKSILKGLRSHLLAGIATPKDAGYVEMYASHYD